MLCLRASRQLFCRPLLSKRHFASRHSFLVAAFHSSKRSLGRHDGQKDKAKNDWKKMVQVSKAILAINTAVRLGGGNDPDQNPMLASALASAQQHNTPKERVQAALNKQLGETKQMFLEVGGVKGANFFVEVETDVPAKSKQNLNIALQKTEGQVLPMGSLGFNYDLRCIVALRKEGLDMDEEAVFEFALEAGADDMQLAEKSTAGGESMEPVYLLSCSFEMWGKVLVAVSKQPVLQAALLQERTGRHYEPKMTVQLDEQAMEQNVLVLEKLRKMDHVVEVYHNMQMAAGS